jgi:DNA-binding response OmpR family regulator
MACILIVDDEIYIRELLQKTLSAEGHRALEARNGHEALETLKNQEVDLMIIDLVMPHKGGLETLMEIRDFNKNIKLIAISGKIETSSDSIRMMASQFQVDEVLPKPFDLDKLLKTVRELT